MYTYSNNGLDYNTNNNLHLSATNYKQKTAKNIQRFIMTTKTPPPSTNTATTKTEIKSHKFNKHFVVLYPKAKTSTSSLTSLLLPSSKSSLSSTTSLSAYTSYSSSATTTTTGDTIRDFVVVDNSNSNNSNNNHTTANNNNHNNNDNNSNCKCNSNNIAYVSNLLKRIKRLAQPRILRVKSSHAGGMGSGYNRRNKEFRFGKCLI